MKKMYSIIALLLSLIVPAVSMAGDHVVASETIWPTQNDVANTAGDGKKFLENQWAKPFALLSPNNYTLSGLAVPGSSASLTINMPLGTAYIAGRHITIPGATAIVAAASNLNYVYLKLTRDGGNLVTGVSYEVNTTGTPPTDSIYLATLTAGASTITATADKRTFLGRIETITGGSAWAAPAGITFVYVEVIGASGGGGGGGASGASPTAGAVGGGGTTTSFGGLSSTAGAGGAPGVIGTSNGSQGPQHGAGSGGTINRTGGGNPGGSGGGGGGTASHNGGDGGQGGYTAGWVDVTPGNDVTLAIGSAGAAGAGGAGSTGNGAAGRAGVAGSIVIHY